MTVTSPKKVSEIIHTWRAPKVPIEISYRDEGNGGSAFYDHYTIQRATDRPTHIVIPRGTQPSAFVSHLTSGTTHNLPYGIPNHERKNIRGD